MKKNRREFLKTTAAGLAGAVLLGKVMGEQPLFLDGDPYPELVEATIADLQAKMTSKQLTSRKLVEMYLERIKVVDQRTHAVLELNPDALSIADSLDKERKKGKRVSFWGEKKQPQNDISRVVGRLVG